MRVLEIQIYNRAPFENIHLVFGSNPVSVLSGINGAGKTTIISYIVDAFHEFAREEFTNSFKGKDRTYYRSSSGISVLHLEKQSFVYIRFNENDRLIDYIDIRGIQQCTQEEYHSAIQIEDHIPYETIKSKFKAINLKYFSSLGSEDTEALFNQNIMTYFPAYRYEQPSYLTDPYSIQLAFDVHDKISGYLPNPIEVTSDLKSVSNWIMDVVLDQQIYSDNEKNTLRNINHVFRTLLGFKYSDPLRLGIGKRNSGAARLAVVKDSNSQPVYPSIFNMSSGEHALICIFCELLHQADKLGRTPEEINGIVLIDEIDKHLHIRLQKEALPKLMRLFPNIQFIITTHSPFVNMGLAEESADFCKIFDLDNDGIACAPQSNDLYQDVYKMMLSENERYADQYKYLVARMRESMRPVLITEGKTDWKHLKSAMRALSIDNLDFEMVEYEADMGDVALMRLLKEMAITKPTRKIIGMFDRDNEAICEELLSEDARYTCLSPNIYAFAIPVANEAEYGLHTSIEHYYHKDDLLKETRDGRRIFLGEEFYPKGYGKTGKYSTRAKGVDRKAMVNGVIDDKVYYLPDDPKEENSVALSKKEFAQLIYEGNPYAKDFDFSEFQKIFDVIVMILALP